MTARRPATVLAGILLAAAAGSVPAATGAIATEGDAGRGKEIYARCGACHSLDYDRVGPHHCGLFGRRAGSVEGFEYSKAMKNSKLVWNSETLDRFIADPLKTVPGTRMGYAGIPDARERADLLAYLRASNDGPECSQMSAPRR